MGNGQHRNRRGARPRPTPHKHGGAGNLGRAMTQLIPPVAPASAVNDDIPADLSAGEDVGEQAAESALSPPPGAPGDLATEPDAGAGQDISLPGPTKILQHHQPGSTTATQTTKMDVEEVPAEEPATHSPAGPATATRSTRFDRFYAPGQGPRPERAERVAPPISPTLPVVVNPPSALPRRAERTERAERAPIVSEPLDEDDSPEYTGPRGDVRGSVGVLIDALHEVFARDRTIASQGGAARCGVCYLHFPTGELTYRDAEGFYVCQSCAHALGASRVPMVRRQQRQ